MLPRYRLTSKAAALASQVVAHFVGSSTRCTAGKGRAEQSFAPRLPKRATQLPECVAAVKDAQKTPPVQYHQPDQYNIQGPERVGAAPHDPLPFGSLTHMTAPSDPLSCLAFTAANLLASDHAQSEDGEKTSAGPSGGQGADDQYAMQPAMLKGEAGQRLNLVKDGPPAGGPETQQHGPPAYLSHGSTQQQHTEAAGELGSEDVAYDDGETDEDETDDDEMAMLGTTGHTQTPRLQEHDHPSPRTQQADGARQLAGDPRHGSSRDDHHSTPVQRTPLPGSTAAEATEVQHPSRASQQTGSMLTEGEGDGGGDGSWADVSGCGAPVARGTAGGAAAGGGERVSMLGRGKRPGERRPTQFWQVFNGECCVRTGTQGTWLFALTL